MKIRTLVSAIMVALVASFVAEAQQKKADKVLIAYYSYRGGNTKAVAEYIQQATGGDLFRIETDHPYPQDYNALTEQASEELEKGVRPKLKRTVPNMADYSVIYIGSPNWWGTIAPVVMTFLEGHNFAGKTIIPFITHEGSRMGKSVNDIKKLAPKAKVLDGFAIRGRNAKNSSEDVEKELKALGQIP